MGTTMKIKSNERILRFRTILKNIFYRSEELPEKAELLIRKINKEKIPDSDWKKVKEELGLTHQQYYTIVNTLKAIGMIEKNNEKWELSNRFSNRCEEMKEIWENTHKQGVEKK